MNALDGEDAALQRALAESMQTAGGLAWKAAVLPMLPTSRSAVAEDKHCTNFQPRPLQRTGQAACSQPVAAMRFLAILAAGGGSRHRNARADALASNPLQVGLDSLAAIPLQLRIAEPQLCLCLRGHRASAMQSWPRLQLLDADGSW